VIHVSNFTENYTPCENDDDVNNYSFYSFCKWKKWPNHRD